MPHTPRLRRFVLCICPAEQRNLLAFLTRTAGYEALEARCVGDALRKANNQSQRIAAVLCCELKPHDTGALAQLRHNSPASLSSSTPKIANSSPTEPWSFISEEALVGRAAEGVGTTLVIRRRERAR